MVQINELHLYYSRVKQYFRRKCKAKVIGGSLITFSIGAFVFTLPHLLSDEYLPMEEQESCHADCTATPSSRKYQPDLGTVLTQYFSEIPIQCGIFPCRTGKYPNGNPDTFLYM